MPEIKIADLFDLTHTKAAEYLSGYTYPWEALPGIKNLILEIGETLDPSEYDYKGEGIWISKSAKIYPNAYIGGPCIIGHNTEVRPGAFIRGSALVGDGCVVGNSTELKNVILFDGVQVPHYNYVGDSILGYKSHMGAGSITSNVKSDKTHVHIKDAASGTDIDTGMKKVGAALGDFVEVGCNSVLNPGTVIGRNSAVYPISSTRGVIPANSIYKTGGKIIAKSQKI
ncbi:MAG: UDP-N-acetylglucosamine pyrophosphorylase [Ruminococcaceae bacterium]|nr:UDP-N-acetylglucosamine pyrophosphorylase [Oscillospiraceae bacterium]